jgi:hypothetical protein
MLRLVRLAALLALAASPLACAREEGLRAGGGAEALGLQDTPHVPDGDETSYLDLPGVDSFLRLAPDLQVAVLARANRAACTCGCPDHTVAHCLHQEKERCDVALRMAQGFVTDAMSHQAYREAEAAGDGKGRRQPMASEERAPEAATPSAAPASDAATPSGDAPTPAPSAAASAGAEAGPEAAPAPVPPVPAEGAAAPPATSPDATAPPAAVPSAAVPPTPTPPDTTPRTPPAGGAPHEEQP